MLRTHVRCVAATAVALVCTAPSARGGLTTRFAVHEGVGAAAVIGQYPSQSSYVDATALPVHQTIAAASGYTGAPDASATATFDVTDDGTTVVYRMASQGQLNALGNASAGSTSVGPGLSDSSATQFVLSAPATFVATLTSTGPVTTQAYAQLDAVDGVHATNVFGLGTISSATGTLAAGVPYTLFDSFGLSNTTFGRPMVNGSGTYAFALTLTAVPEPAAAGVLAVAAAGLLGRRRRRALLPPPPRP